MLTKVLVLAIMATVSIAANSSERSDVAHFNPAGQNCFPRQKAPFFSATGVLHGKFHKYSLHDYAGKYLVIVFYPFDFTYVCPTELIGFSEQINKFREINADVVAVSTDSHFTHLAWTKTLRAQGGVGDLDIPLLADISKRISKNYGVLVEDETDELFGAALRGLFIIDGKGIIRTMQINDAPVGRSVDETLRLVKAFQHTDKYGEVCPLNWQPGDQTIKPDQDEKLSFFKQAYEEVKEKIAGKEN